MRRLRQVQLVEKTEQKFSLDAGYSASLDREYSSSEHSSTSEYSSLPQALKIPSSSAGATTLISAGILILAIWSVTQISGLKSFGERPAQAARAVHTDSAAKRPPLDATVTTGSLGIYHWKPDCPLENAPSLRRTSTHSMPRSFRCARRITRRKAELHGSRYCQYCAEMDYWHHNPASPRSQ